VAVQTDYRYQVWVTGTFRKKGKRPVLIGDDLELLTDYAQRQRVKTHIRMTRSGALVWPKEDEGHRV
jgi:hypothetical protein